MGCGGSIPSLGTNLYNHSMNRSKEQTLGMPYGTACNRLRKSLLFSLFQRLGEATCFRCRKPINSVDEFTIEHKREWEGVSADLFFDLRNIACSHPVCNRPRVHGSIKRRKVGPKDTSWCSACKTFRPKFYFNKNRTRWGGLDAYCRECRAKRKNASKTPA